MKIGIFELHWGDVFTFGFGLLGAIVTVVVTALGDVPGNPDELKTWLAALGANMGTAALIYVRAYLAQYLARKP